FDRTGLDIDPELLRVAGTKLPDVRLVHSDMADFDLGSQFDVVLCLFSAIGYVVTVPKLNAAISCMARHLNPSGVLCVEPWFTPEQWLDPKASMRTAEKGDLKVCRIFEGGQRGKTSTNTLHYLVANGGKVEYFTESHNLGLFTQDEMRHAFEIAGLTVEFDLVVCLLIVMVILVTVARRLNVSQPIVLVLGGLLLALFPRLPEVRLDPE